MLRLSAVYVGQSGRKISQRLKEHKGNRSIYLRSMGAHAESQISHVSPFQHFTSSPEEVQLYGVCSKGGPLYIVQEYLGKGSLLDFLSQDQGKTLRFEDQVLIAYQVANGMAHLESLNFIHRDLAARNVLLSENNDAKICDFGLARIMDQEIYTSQGGKFPIKWTAPEALTRSIFTIKSDVWSFGILLMELFTYGVTPYEGIPPSAVFELVSTGYRMKKPANLPDEIYEMMLRCWHEVPERRPTFHFLEKYFGSMDVSYRSGLDVVLKHNMPNSYDDHTLTRK